MTDKEIIIDSVNVSKCSHFVPRYMEDYDIDTLNYCGYHYKPCKKVDIKHCYFKQLARKTTEYNKYKQALNEIEKCIKEYVDNKELYNRRLNKILDIITKAKE